MSQRLRARREQQPTEGPTTRHTERLSPLERQFKGTLAQARRLLQQELVDFLEANPTTAADFIRALGLHELNSKRGGWHPAVWRKNRNRWVFLPFVFGGANGAGDTDPPGLSYPVTKPDRERTDCQFVASTFASWLYLFDTAQATYYYPFPGTNLVFGLDRSPYVLWPRDSYHEFLGGFLEGYRLMIGEGSQGTAARGARTCVLPNTFADVRGGVALEDLLLRNFAYASFPLFPAGRTTQVPFAYLAMIFPAPMASGTSALDQVASFLERSYTSAAAALFEPLVNHLQDQIISEKQQDLVRALKGREKRGQFEETVAQFAKVLLRPPERSGAQHADYRATQSTLGSGLRDPFSFAALHVVPPPDLAERGEGPTQERVHRYNPSPSTLSTLLRGALEAAVSPGTGAGPGVSFEQEVRGWAETTRAMVGREVDPRVIASATLDPRSSSNRLGRLTLDQVVVSRFTSRTEKSPNLPGTATVAETLNRFWTEALNDITRQEKLFRKWINGNLESRHEQDETWGEFERGVLDRKVFEITVRMVGDLVGRVLSSPSPGAEWGKAIVEQETLEEVIGVQSKGLFKVSNVEEVERALTCFGQEPAMIVALLVGEDCGRVDHQWSSPDGQSRLRHSERALDSPPVRRTMAAVARLGDLMPRCVKTSRPLSSKYRVVRVTPELLGVDGPLGSRVGIHRRPGHGYATLPYNYSLMTTLSDPWLWGAPRTSEEEKDPAWTSGLDYLYWVDLREDSSGRGSVLVALGPLVHGRALEDRLALLKPGDTPCSRLAELLGEGGVRAVCTQWDIGGESRDRELLSWKVNTDEIAALVEAGVSHEADSKDLARVRQLLSFCLIERQKTRSAQPETRPPDCPALAAGEDCSVQVRPGSRAEPVSLTQFCFPEVVFSADRDGQSDWTLASAGTFRRCRLQDQDLQHRPDECPHPHDADITGETKRLLGGGSGIFDPRWGLCRHLLWPIATPGRERSEDLGFFVFSSFVPALVDPLGEQRCPFLLGDTHYALLDAAVDHVEFVLGGDRAQQDLIRYLGGFAHSLRRRLRAQQTDRQTLTIFRNIAGHSTVTSAENPHLQAKAIAQVVSGDPVPLRNLIIHSWLGANSRIDEERYCTMSLVDALTRTLAGLPEWPLAEMYRSDAHPLEPPFRSCRDWIEYLVWRWGAAMPSDGIEAIRGGVDWEALAHLSFYPGSSVEMVIDEMLRNMKKYYAEGEGWGKVKFRFTLDNAGCIIITAENPLPVIARTVDSTRQGHSTIRQIIGANTGDLDAFVFDESDGWAKQTARLDLREYQRRVERLYSLRPVL